MLPSTVSWHSCNSAFSESAIHQRLASGLGVLGCCEDLSLQQNKL